MNLYQEWEKLSSQHRSDAAEHAFWQDYLKKEEDIYRQILKSGEAKIEGTIKELSAYYNINSTELIGFLDGINTSLEKEVNLEDLEADSKVNLTIDFKKLLFNMHKAKAEWLYEIKEWSNILTDEQREEVKKEYVSSNTARKSNLPKRNEPCHCGSGKKFKKCCIKENTES